MRAAEDQPERDRPAGRAHPAGGAHDDRDHDQGDHRQDHRETGAERERRAGVAGDVEVDRAAEQAHLVASASSLATTSDLRDDVERQHR